MEDYRLIEPVRRTTARHDRVSTIRPQKHSQTVKLTPEELKSFLRYESPIYSAHDPLRPLGYFDSWAGKPKPKFK